MIDNESRPLTRIEQLEFLTAHYKKMLLEIKRELIKAEEELQEERNMVRQRSLISYPSNEISSN